MIAILQRALQKALPPPSSGPLSSKPAPRQIRQLTAPIDLLDTFRPTSIGSQPFTSTL
jgi:hypothetical protein